MGNESQYEQKPKYTLITIIRNALFLRIDDKEHFPKTRGLVQFSFAKEFNRCEMGPVDRNMNPFCPVIVDSSLWVTGCIVSPVMLLATSEHLVKNNRLVGKESSVSVIFQNQIISLSLKAALTLKDSGLCLLLLKTPFWKVGWIGIGCIERVSDLKSLQTKFVNHPRAEFDKAIDGVCHVQEIKQHLFKGAESNDLIISNKYIKGSLLCAIVDKKPYTIGFQRDQFTLQLLSAKFLEQVQSTVSGYLTAERQKQILLQIDTSAFQRDTTW